MKTAALMLIGLTAGAMSSRGLVGAIHETKAGLTEADAKKQNLVLLGKRAAIVAGAGYAAAGLKGTDDVSVIAKNAALGAAAMQVIDGVKDVAANSTKVAALAAGTKTQRAIATSLGLGCACENTSYMALPLNKPRRRSLNSPAMVQFQPLDENPYQRALNNGSMAI